MRTIKAPLVQIPYDSDKIYLHADRHEVSRHHWEGYAEDGVGFSFDLDTTLKHDDAFHTWKGKVYILQQNPEKVFRVEYGGNREFAYVTWQAGNMHLAIQFLEDGFLVEDVPASRHLLEKHGVSYTVIEEIRLVPETQARSHHTHSHHHGHHLHHGHRHRHGHHHAH